MAGEKSTSARRSIIGVLIVCLLIYRVLRIPEAARIHIRSLFLANWPLWVSAVLWILFSIYWDIAAKKSAPQAQAESGSSRAFHVFLVNVALVLLFAPIPGLTSRFIPATPMLIPVGLAVQVGGILLAIEARRHLGQNWSGRVTIKVGHELVRSGPYRLMRHPIYTAILVMYAGTTILSGEFHALVGFVLAVLAYWRKLRIEEAKLADAFGAAWVDYRRSTRALLPGLF